MPYQKKWIVNSNFDEFWLSEIKKGKPESHFLVMLAPLLKKAYAVFTRLTEKNAVLHSLLSKENLIQFLLTDFTNLFARLLSRVCVYEMHAASQNGHLKGKTSTERFNDFIQNLASADVTIAILKKYPALAKLMNILFDQYMMQQKLIFERLVSDLPELCDSFFAGNKVFQITQIERTGDLHKDGACVAIIEFDCNPNTKIVYKPRSTKIDLAFQKLIDWLNNKNEIIGLQYSLIVDKNDYGWCEYINHKLCETKEEIERYYQRMGTLLGLCYTLGTIDLHGENIIAQGEHPHIVDVECLLRPVIEENHSLPLENIIHHVVIDTLLLPGRVMMTDDFDGIDISGISGNPQGKGPYQYVHWDNPGTDMMKIVRKANHFKSFVNIPFNDSSIHVYDYENVITNEFKKCYQLILKYRKELLSINSPLNYFKETEIRVVLRPTHCYSQFLAECNHPRLLNDFKLFRSHFRALKTNVQNHKFSKTLIQSELHDLLKLSIPYFSCDADGLVVYNSKRIAIDIPVRLSCLDRMKAQLEFIFSEEDLKRQILLIENSFTSLKQNSMSTAKAVVTHSPNTNVNIDRTIAMSIAKREVDILSETMLMRNGYITWSSLDLYNDRFWLPSFTGLHLYNGVPGIALTFAYSAKLFNNDIYANIAAQCMRFMESRMQQQGVKCVRGIGAFNGLGGLIYTYGVLYTLLKDKRALAILKQLIKWINSFPLTDNDHDVIFGHAGLIGALHSVRHIIAQKTLNELLKNIAEGICTQFTPRSADAKQLGFSHGLAGMCWALSKCLNLGINNTIEQWFIDALKHQRSFQIYEHKEAHLTHDNHNWCHGSAGIGLCRLAMMGSWSDILFQSEIEASLQATINHGLTISDNLCHGTLGNLEFLMSASQNKSYRHYQKKYQKEKNNIISRIYIDGPSFLLPGKQPTPGLMTGRSGIAYQMMRLTQPHLVPSILLLEEAIA